jgi:nitrogen-specific signal transduction histidine kinase
MEVTQTFREIRIQGLNLLKKAYASRVNDLESSISIGKSVVALGYEINDEELIAQARNQLGLFYMIRGQFEESKKCSEEALAYFEKVNDLKGIADAKYSIAGLYYKTDNYHIGLEVLLDCLYIYRKLGDQHNEARVLKSMGTIYEYFGDQENAISAYLNSISAGRLAKDPNLESNAYNPLSGIYLKKGLVDLALSTIEKSIEIKNQTKDLRGLAFALYGRGKVYIKLARFEEAVNDLNTSIELHLKMGDNLGVAMAYNKLGVLSHELGRFQEARRYLLEAQGVATKFNIQFINYKTLYNLHLVCKSENKHEEALNYLDKYLTLKESVINNHTYNVIKSYEAISRVKALEHEAEVQRSKTEIIEKKNAELDSFFYRVSHDLKGPISSLLGLHNLVKLEIKDENAKQYFEMYQSQIMRINNIVMDLINITRMNHAASNLVKIDFDLLVTECIEAYHYLHNYSIIKFIREVDPNIEFYSEWAIINTILQNLIENAIKYANPDNDPFVKIVIAQEDSSIRIMVEDNGVGIAPDYQAKIFDMFFRANDHVEGTGLGLYILKRAVERLRGEIKFHSEVGVGSAFVITLPLTYKRV